MKDEIEVKGRTHKLKTAVALIIVSLLIALALKPNFAKDIYYLVAEKLTRKESSVKINADEESAQKQPTEDRSTNAKNSKIEEKVEELSREIVKIKNELAQQVEYKNSAFVVVQTTFLRNNMLVEGIDYKMNLEALKVITSGTKLASQIAEIEILNDVKSYSGLLDELSRLQTQMPNFDAMDWEGSGKNRNPLARFITIRKKNSSVIKEPATFVDHVETIKMWLQKQNAKEALHYSEKLALKLHTQHGYHLFDGFLINMRKVNRVEEILLFIIKNMELSAINPAIPQEEAVTQKN